jgi:hypothetical protein
MQLKGSVYCIPFVVAAGEENLVMLFFQSSDQDVTPPSGENIVSKAI